MNSYVTFLNLGQMGHLGNQLFQIASTIGVARKNGLPYVFPEWHYRGYRYSTHFGTHPLPMPGNLNRDHVVWSFIENMAIFGYNDISFSITPLHAMQPMALYNLNGYFQSEKYFAHCSDLIVDHLMPNSVVAMDDTTTCSIHVRRGDYVNNPHYIDLSSNGYYERAISKVADFVGESNVLFKVYSDNIDFCTEYFTRLFPRKKFAFINSGKDWMDLHSMANCDHHIIANSSFSWWGAWFGEKLSSGRGLVIAPKEWFGPAYTRARPSMAKDIVPLRWAKV